MSQIQNATVLITGGASGIGKLMGESVLQKGAKTLVIWDVNETLLNTVASEFKTKGYHVMPYVVNVIDIPNVIATAEKVKNEIGKIDILINNAGIIVGKDFVEHTHQEIENTMGINANALMHITKEFLPAMLQSNKGHIVNIASAAGLVGNPKMSVYVASKFAVVGWSESLCLEMEEAKNNITITTVTPFYISTGMFDGVHSPIIPIVNPEKATRKIIDGIESNKRFVRMPGIVYLVPLFKGIFPTSMFNLIVGKWFGIHKSMNKFKGRK
jgi:short-subunit dehydrogenase